MTTVNMTIVRERLRRSMKKAGVGSRPLSEMAGLGQTAVRDLLEGKSDNPRIGTLSSLANALAVPLDFLLGKDEVPVVGKIGAGGTIAFLDDFSKGEGHAFVPQPPDTVGEMIGLEIEGDSMLPKFDPGEVVYISREHEGVLPDYLGQYCAVRLGTGEVLLKILARGTLPGRFTLRSLNAADIEDVEVEWATPVRATLSRWARRS